MISQNRSSHVLYLFLMFFFATEGWGLRIFHTNFLGGNLFVILAFSHILYGLFVFKEGRVEKLWPWVIILIGIFISIIPANIFWHQRYIDSILLYRLHIWLFYLPVLCKMRPKMDEIYKAIGPFVVGFSVIWFYQALTRNLIVSYYDVGLEDGRYSQIFENEIGFSVGGLHLVLILFYHYLSECIEHRTSKNMTIMLLLFIQLLLVSRRSVLFFAALMLVFVILKWFRKSENVIANILILCVVAVGLILSFSIWDSLVEETKEQLGDTEGYARWLSVDFFVNRFSPSMVCKIIGNGFLSLKTAGGQMIEDMSVYSIYIQDIGLLGNWVQYGVLPIIAIYFVTLRMVWFKRKSYPWDIKFLAIHISLLPTAWQLLNGIEYVLIYLLYWYVLVESKNDNYERAFS